MNSEPLVRGILAALLLLENSNESEINPDVAVAGMEAISHELQQMAPSDAEEFIALVGRIVEGEVDPAYREFYRSVPFALGILS